MQSQDEYTGPSSIVKQIAHTLDKQNDADIVRAERVKAAVGYQTKIQHLANIHAKKLESEATHQLELMQQLSSFQMDAHLKEEITKAQQNDKETSAVRNIVLDELFTQVLDDSHKYQQKLVNECLPSKLSLYFKNAQEIEPLPDSDDEEIENSNIYRMRHKHVFDGSDSANTAAATTTPATGTTNAASKPAAEVEEPKEEEKSVFSKFF